MCVSSHIIFQVNGQNADYELDETELLQDYIDAKRKEIAKVIVFLIFYKAVIKFEIDKLVFLSYNIRETRMV